MKRNILLFILVCFLLFLSTCKKEDEIKYPSLLIGTWKFIGFSTNSNLDYPKYEFPGLLFISITQDSLFVFEGTLKNPTESIKIQYIDNFHIYYEKRYLVEDSTLFKFEYWKSYEIRNDILIEHRENCMCEASGFYNYYRFYPN